MMASIFILMVAALVGSGLLFRHQRVLTYLSTAGVLWEGAWLVLTVVDRVLLEAVASERVYLVGSILFLVITLLGSRRWSFPYRGTWGSGRRDLVVLLVLFIALSATFIVQQANGFGAAEDASTFVMNGFYNGDTVTLISLTQQAFEVPGLPEHNPFAFDTKLEYPTLLHAGIATLMRFLGQTFEWIYFLPIMTLTQVVFTVGTFFLLWDVVMPEPSQHWKDWFGASSRVALLLLQGLVVLYVMAITWDAYIYPQSHFFLTALFLVTVALLIRGWWWVAAPFTLVLLLSNAVTGTAAVAMTVVYYILQASIQTNERLPRLLFVGGVVVWAGLFLWLTPGNASFGILQFSYSSAESFGHLLPALLLLVGIVWLVGDHYPLLSLGGMVLIGMSFFTFFFSDRDIVVENANRFAYHGLLVTFPLALPALVRLYYVLKRLLLATPHSWNTRLVAWLALVFGLMFVALPAGVGVVKSHDHTMFQDHQEVTLDMRLLGWWITENTPPDAVFLTSPKEPWYVPLLTGRLQVRTDDYWLSPQDALLADQNAAFWQGDADAQQRVLAVADYLLLTDDQRTVWGLLPYETVQRANDLTLYRLH